MKQENSNLLKAVEKISNYQQDYFPFKYNHKSNKHCSKNKVSLKVFLSKCEQITENCKFVNIYYKKTSQKTFFLCSETTS